MLSIIRSSYLCRRLYLNGEILHFYSLNQRSKCFQFCVTVFIILHVIKQSLSQNIWCPRYANFPQQYRTLSTLMITFIFIQLCFFRINVYCLVALKLGVFEFSSPRTPALISDTRPTTPIKYSTSPTSSYLKFSPYDHVHITFNDLWVI